MEPTYHELDYNQLYRLALSYDPSQKKLTVRFDDPSAEWPRFPKALMAQLNLAGQSAMTREANGYSVSFSPVSREFTLRLSEEAIGTYSISKTGSLNMVRHRPLIVDETRRIGNFYQHPPYAQHREGLSIEERHDLVENAKGSVFTDFHTHSSGQISASGLVGVAMQHRPYYYPTYLMQLAGIDTSYDHIPSKARKSIPRVPFPPLERDGETYPDTVEGADLHALDAADIRKLSAYMSLPADRQRTFRDLEYRVNRFRYPISKDPRLTEAIRQREAEEYAAQGVQAALSSFVGIDKPATLRSLHHTVEALKENAATQGFLQRFMVGIPRGLHPLSIQEMLDKTKILLDSPYIMGVDMLGFENSKTEEFIEDLDRYAAWANTHKPGSFIRVHAGENDKNHDNVKDFLKVAVKYPHLKFLVGHGVYGMDAETIQLLKRLGDRVTVELNPGSNIALNNVDNVRQLPFAELLKHHIPFVIGSDSAGVYQTDALQLGMAAYYAGLTHEGFAALRAHQQHLLDHMRNYSQGIAQQIPNWDTQEGKEGHLTHMIEQLAQIPRAQVPKPTTLDTQLVVDKLKRDEVVLVDPRQRPPELEGKFPVTIIGASGASWERISPAEQRESRIAIDMLIHALGEQCYVVQGRTKKEGLSKAINDSLGSANDARREKRRGRLYSVGLLVNPSFDESHSYKHLSHMVRIEGSQLDLAMAVSDHTFDHEGVIVAVGGAAYTRDTILEADQRGIRDKTPSNRKMLLLMSNAEGASAEKAKVLHPDYAAADAKTLITKLYKTRRDLFAPEFKLSKLDALYEESAQRIAHYDMKKVRNTLVEQPALEDVREVRPPRRGRTRTDD